ncbi:Hypothetical protein CINCED_3A010152 [Cinara cedri]|uniref:Uncharacterized protein n=1 Tax=Cinara cedri TaxID=506608 RepID=A0A5E4M1S1_9HEMI|nr:Hypothetical protein CINCED_3A010152 [Cinara cedri]
MNSMDINLLKLVRNEEQSRRQLGAYHSDARNLTGERECLLSSSDTAEKDDDPDDIRIERHHRNSVRRDANNRKTTRF